MAFLRAPKTRPLAGKDPTRECWRKFAVGIVVSVRGMPDARVGEDMPVCSG